MSGRVGWYLLSDGKTPYHGPIPAGAEEVAPPTSAAGAPDQLIDAGNSIDQVGSETLVDEGETDGEELVDGQPVVDGLDEDPEPVGHED